MKKTNWSVYDQELQQRIGLWIGRVKTPDDIERELSVINRTIMQSFDKACPWHRVSGRTRTPWWTRELTTLRRKTNRAFHVAYNSGKVQDWESYKDIRIEYTNVLSGDVNVIHGKFTAEISRLLLKRRAYIDY
jgi:hypothetical protein